MGCRVIGAGNEMLMVKNGWIVGGSVSDGHAAQHKSLEGEAGAEADEEAEVVALAGGGGTELERAVADLVEDEEHGGGGHVAELGQDISAALHLVFGEVELGFDLVEDGGAAGVDSPEHVVPVGGADALASLGEEFLDVLGDEARDVLHEVEDEAGFGEVAVDGAIALGQDGFAGPVDFEEGLLVGLGVGAHDEDAGAVAE